MVKAKNSKQTKRFPTAKFFDGEVLKCSLDERRNMSKGTIHAEELRDAGAENVWGGRGSIALLCTNIGSCRHTFRFSCRRFAHACRDQRYAKSVLCMGISCRGVPERRCTSRVASRHMRGHAF